MEQMGYYAAGGGGAGGPITKEYIGTNTNDASTAVRTFSNEPIGAAEEGRVVFVSVTARSVTGTDIEVPQVTIGSGIPMTLMSSWTSTGGSPSLSASIHAAFLPDGDTADIVVDHGDIDAKGTTINVYRVMGIGSLDGITDTKGQGGTGDNSFNTTLDVQENNFLLGVAINYGGSRYNATWVGVTEDNDIAATSLVSATAASEEQVILNAAHPVSCNISASSIRGVFLATSYRYEPPVLKPFNYRSSNFKVSGGVWNSAYLGPVPEAGETRTIVIEYYWYSSGIRTVASATINGVPATLFPPDSDDSILGEVLMYADVPLGEGNVSVVVNHNNGAPTESAMILWSHVGSSSLVPQVSYPASGTTLSWDVPVDANGVLIGIARQGDTGLGITWDVGLDENAAGQIRAAQFSGYQFSGASRHFVDAETNHIIQATLAVSGGGGNNLGRVTSWAPA